MALHVSLQSDRPPGGLGPLRLRSAGPAHRTADRGAAVRRGKRAAGRARLRKQPRLERPHPVAMTGPIESLLRVACVQMNPVIGETRRNVARTLEFVAQA